MSKVDPAIIGAFVVSAIAILVAALSWFLALESCSGIHILSYFSLRLTWKV